MGSDDDVYIPPSEINVRICGFASKRVLVSRTHEDPHFWHHPMGDVYDDQWFHLVPGSGSHSGEYLIQSNYTDKYLWCRKDEPRVGAISGTHNDNYFVFEPGSGSFTGWFRMKTPSTGHVFVSRTHMDPQLDAWPADSRKNDDNYFTFMMEDMKVEGLVFDTDAGNIAGTTPLFLGKQTIPNHTSTDQSFTAHFTLQEDNEYSFEHTAGFTITIGTEFSVGLPGVADGKVSMSASHSEEFKWGTTTKAGKGTSYDFQVTAKPMTTVTAHAVITRSTLNVPYTMTLKSKATGHKVTEKGIFKGVQMYDASCTYTEEKL